MRAYRCTHVSELRRQLCVRTGNRLGDRHGGHPRKEVFDERRSRRASISRRAVDSMKQFADRDHADRYRLIREYPTDRFDPAVPLKFDQYAGVDQEGQADSSGATACRIDFSSATKSSSTAGAVSRIAWK